MLKHLLFLLLVCTQYALYSTAIIVPGSLTHEYSVKPKAKVFGEIPIQNKSDKMATVQVSLVDYLFNTQRESLFLDKGITKRSCSSWVEMGKT
jgi:hypothetical protein